MDPILLGIGQKRQIHYMGKQELFENKILAWLIRSLGAFPVKRGTSDTSSIDTAFGILEDERILGIFPEGTRSKDGELLKAKAGAALIAYKEQSPVVPAAIYAKGGKVGLFKKVYVAFGEPLTIEQLGMSSGTSKELRDATRNIMDRISKLRDECIEYSERKVKK